MTNKTQQTKKTPEKLDHLIWVKQLTQTRVLCDLALQSLTEITCILELHNSNDTIHISALKALTGFSDTLGDLSDISRALEKTILQPKKNKTG